MAQDALRHAYDILNFYITCRKLMPTGTMGYLTMDDLIREQRRKIRQINQYNCDPLARSLRDEWRHRCSEDGESGYDYRIIPDNGETEKEAIVRAEDLVGFPPIRGPYDCTGKPFTRWIKAHRVPSGIVIIHSWGLDV